MTDAAKFLDESGTFDTAGLRASGDLRQHHAVGHLAAVGSKRQQPATGQHGWRWVWPRRTSVSERIRNRSRRFVVATDISLQETTYQVGDRRWLLSPHGTDYTPGVTLDVAKVHPGHALPERVHPVRDRGRDRHRHRQAGPYKPAASDGTEVAAGILFADCRVIRQRHHRHQCGFGGAGARVCRRGQAAVPNRRRWCHRLMASGTRRHRLSLGGKPRWLGPAIEISPSPACAGEGLSYASSSWTQNQQPFD